MQLTDIFRPRDSNVASEDFDGEFVVLDLESGKYFSLADGAGVVWRALLDGHSIASMTAALPAEDTRRATIESLVGALVAHTLIVVADAPAGAPSAATAEAVANSGGPFTLEVYEDLADLLIADPIHDVDQGAGWPRRPQDD